MFTREELLKLFEKAGAIRHGHFELSSGLHSGTYVQCALVLQYPRFAEKLGQALAALFSDARIDAVVSPALGGVIIGQEVARALPAHGDALGGGVPAMFVERDGSGRCACEGDFRLSRIRTFWSWRMSGRRVARRRKRSALWKRRAGAWWRRVR